ncbi:MAG: RnfABCDGE type electron transport complex subunit D [Candidatus Omnitrophica bacterium]|nr:RnfABCDGE type electron transport complex subunit D [Candidatus Omnitrophota bacterium]
MSAGDSAPHIHGGESVPALMAKTVGALFPAILAFLIFFRLDGLWLILASIAGAFLAEVSGGKLFRIKISLEDGSSLFTALLYVLFLPADIPLWMAAGGAFFAVFAGKMCFGGLGANPFNPALIGRIFLQINFPQAMNWPAGIETAPASTVFIFCFVLGGILLCWLKVANWEFPFFYLAGGLIFSYLFGLGASFFLASSLTYLTAFFVVTDPVTTPLTKRAAKIFMILAAGLALFLKARGVSYLQATAYSVLILNAMVPWLEAWFRTRRAPPSPSLYG